MIVDITDETNQLSIKTRQFLEELIRYVATTEKLPKQTEISLNIVDDETIQALNLQYRGLDEPTDVLSFALQDNLAGELEVQRDEEMPLILGDIILSLEQAQLQAKRYNHSLKRELGFLVVHGFLHLLGYDHLTKADEKIMFAKQESLLRAFGLERE